MVVINVGNVLKTVETGAILWFVCLQARPVVLAERGFRHKLIVDFGDYYATAESTWYSIIEILTVRRRLHWVCLGRSRGRARRKLSPRRCKYSSPRGERKSWRSSQDALKRRRTGSGGCSQECVW